MLSRRDGVGRLVVAALFALSALLLGVAHQPLVASDRLGPVVLAPDGTSAEICGSGDAPAAHVHRCDVCTLVAAAAPPPPVFFLAGFVAGGAASAESSVDLLVPLARWRPDSARAPPASLA
ncbi:MAG: hypothetical protein ACFCUS_14625 [Rubrimonas sp.]